MKRLNPDMISHSLSLCGLNAYRATILEMAERINEIQAAVDELQAQVQPGPEVERRLAGLEHVISEELLCAIMRPGDLREFVAEIAGEKGTGVRGQERDYRPSSIPDTITMAGTPADSWLPDDWVVQYVAAVEVG